MHTEASLTWTERSQYDQFESVRSIKHMASSSSTDEAEVRLATALPESSTLSTNDDSLCWASCDDPGDATRYIEDDVPTLSDLQRVDERRAR
jgi:hypothetical protein